MSTLTLCAFSFSLNVPSKRISLGSEERSSENLTHQQFYADTFRTQNTFLSAITSMKIAEISSDLWPQLSRKSLWITCKSVDRLEIATDKRRDVRMKNSSLRYLTISQVRVSREHTEWGDELFIHSGVDKSGHDQVRQTTPRWQVMNWTMQRGFNSSSNWE